MKDKKEVISEIKSILIDHTDECFMVSVASDDIGFHYCAHLVRGSVDVDKLRVDLHSMPSKKRCLIMLHEASYIKFKLECKERKND
jgi:hypothetical protein